MRQSLPMAHGRPDELRPDPRRESRDRAGAVRPSVVRRWRRRLADERAEARVYRGLAGRRPGRTGRSCSGWPTRRNGTPRTGHACSAPRRHRSRRGGSRLRCWRSWPGGSGRCSCWRWLSGRRAGRRRASTSTPRRRWPPTSGCTRKWSAAWPPAAAPAFRAPSGPRCSVPTTAWSATSSLVLGVVRRWCLHDHRVADRAGRTAVRGVVDGGRGVRVGSVAAGAAGGIIA